jgi:hypothetical protein
MSIEQQLATFQVAGFFSIEPKCAAIRASKACFATDLCFKRSTLMLLLAKSWLGLGVQLILHLTYDTNLQVKQ